MSRAVANPLLVEAEADPYVRRPLRRAVERRSGRRWRWWRGSAGRRMSRAGEGRQGRAGGVRGARNADGEPDTCAHICASRTSSCQLPKICQVVCKTVGDMFFVFFQKKQGWQPNLTNCWRCSTTPPAGRLHAVLLRLLLHHCRLDAGGSCDGGPRAVIATPLPAGQ